MDPERAPEEGARPPGYDIRELSLLDWEKIRDVRSRALADSPDAMWPYGPEREWTEREWAPLFDGARWLVAESAGEIVAVLRSAPDRESPRSRRLESIWVDPAHRRRRVFTSMLRTIVEMEAARGVEHLWLWVIDNNDVARKAYEQLGFEQTGDPKPLPPDKGGHELRMSLAIARPLST